MIRRIMLACANLIFVIYVYPGSAECSPLQSFSLCSDLLTGLDENKVYAAWNPSNPQLALKPGVKVFFFGRGVDCDIDTVNGPVASKGNVRFSQAKDLTGVGLSSNMASRWTPSADYYMCNKNSGNNVADSFIHINTNNSNCGIGLFTFTGQDKQGRRPFFQPFDKSGKGGGGVNSNIEGSFVSARFDWKDGGVIRPWAGHGGANRSVAIINTIQGVSVKSVDAGIGNVDVVVQAKQQLVVSIFNKKCLLEKAGKTRVCQFQYLFNLALYRTGVADWGKEKWFKYAGVLLDEGQGGVAVVRGPVPSAGEQVEDLASGLQLYESNGIPTQHDLFDDGKFSLKITHAHLVNALKIIAAKKLDKDAKHLGVSELSEVFGPDWRDPDVWGVLSVQFGQEVYNPLKNNSAYIGGNVKDLSIGQESSGGN